MRSDYEVLDLFIEAGEELRSSSFAKRLAGRISVGVWGDTKHGVILSRLEGADRESLKAFLLTLRALRDHYEQTSLRNVAERVTSMGVDPALKAEFLSARDRFNDFLDERLRPRMAGIGTDKQRDLFETFLGGLHTHSDPESRERLKRWERLPHYPHLEYQFLQALAKFVEAVGKMAEACRGMLAMERA